MSTQTVFVALEREAINLWVLKNAEVEMAFKEIGVSVNVKYENRALDEREGDEQQNKESCQEIAGCKNNYLRLLYDSIIGPIASVLVGEEFVIVPDGDAWSLMPRL